ncbi:cytosolic phospholipase A2 gamma-like [Siphateles boraxobius]|uniref:cytosolic phospholipase A2 gamma-like n=1 Tax=Siphateles boraxobius TaxID=180520 RepID=UPI004064C4F0
MGPSKPQESEVRIEHSLNKKEKEFVVRRRNDVLQSLKKMKIRCSENKVPNIALLGSGGAERAMVGLLGSLDQLQKTGLLDCVLYLSGVSGSTWCMASLYQESDWSTKLETVKDKIVPRLSGPAVSWGDALAKLKKYYYEKDIFSLTDVWAVMFVTTIVKEVDEHTLSDQRDRHKDPFPIYTAIDKQSKQSKDADPWFEFTPYEAGYSLTGAFVETSDFGSKFENGRKIENQPEIDMLYLQALCGSTYANEDEKKKLLLERIKEFLKHEPLIETEMVEEMGKENTNSPPIDKYYQVLMDLVDMNLSVLNGKDPSAHDKSIRTKLNEISGGKHQLSFRKKKLNLPDKEAAKQYMKLFTVDLFNGLSNFWPFDLWVSIFKCMSQWIWGRKYDFLHNMKDKAVPAALLESETRDYIDAGLLLNSPYLSVLREERNIDLIISLDFSESEPFKTVRDAAETCRKLKIPFPEVNIPEDVKKPKDFYVFKGQNTPTVIHIPLFNVVNCGDKVEEWRKKYATFQGPYSAEMITDLMEVAGKNITNNKEKLLEQIRLAIEMHK